MTTKTTKIADRYAALVLVAKSEGVKFDEAKRPVKFDCDELSAAIDAHRAALAVTVAFDEGDDEGEDASDAVADVAPTPAEERAAAIEAKRADARRRFETATKATTAHGYALIAAATADGDRMMNLRAKLAEMPEAVRAGACRLAAEKLVQPGSTMQRDLRVLHDEQPATERKATGGRSVANGERLCTVSKPGGRAVLHLTLPEAFRAVDKVRVVVDGDTITITKI